MLPSVATFVVGPISVSQYTIRLPADRVANVVAKSRSVRHKSLFLAGLMAVMSALNTVVKSELYLSIILEDVGVT